MKKIFPSSLLVNYSASLYSQRHQSLSLRSRRLWMESVKSWPAHTGISTTFMRQETSPKPRTTKASVSCFQNVGKFDSTLFTISFGYETRSSSNVSTSHKLTEIDLSPTTTSWSLCDQVGNPAVIYCGTLCPPPQPSVTVG